MLLLVGFGMMYFVQRQTVRSTRWYQPTAAKSNYPSLREMAQPRNHTLQDMITHNIGGDIYFRPFNITEASKQAVAARSPNSPALVEVNLSKELGLHDNTSIRHVTLPPGTRLSPPLAYSSIDVLVTCISGCGLLWQNGWTYPFLVDDSAGWKAGTGTCHTIINEGGPDTEDLVLLIAQEVSENNLIHYAFENDRTADAQESELWQDPPVQNEMGPHPGVPRVSFDGTLLEDIPDVFEGPRPSNVTNGPLQTGEVGEGGMMFALATSLSQETGLSGRIGINLEIAPPGTRSSDPHAHSDEDELIYVLKGRGIVWMNGYVYPVSQGDAIGFPSGTGIAHVFINDSNSQNEEEGEDWELWIFGENKRRHGDKLYYPLNPEKRPKLAALNQWWDDCPPQELGSHLGMPSRPRSDD
ncbi:hypothetical protein FRC03_012825 [Tulasnella sp. 419]|nr:hypothetical protein FRC03_012825 [Tulasnella sp. 419]